MLAMCNNEEHDEARSNIFDAATDRFESISVDSIVYSGIPS